MPPRKLWPTQWYTWYSMKTHFTLIRPVQGNVQHKPGFKLVDTLTFLSRTTHELKAMLLCVLAEPRAKSESAWETKYMFHYHFWTFKSWVYFFFYILTWAKRQMTDHFRWLKSRIKSLLVDNQSSRFPATVKVAAWALRTLEIHSSLAVPWWEPH